LLAFCSCSACQHLQHGPAQILTLSPPHVLPSLPPAVAAQYNASNGGDDDEGDEDEEDE
jgi:hypothetical protein